jgi:hypothetical protein
MKIVEQTESHMVVRKPLGVQALASLVPLVIGVCILTQAADTAMGVLIGFAFVGSGLLSLLRARRVVIEIDRPRGTVAIDSKSLLEPAESWSASIGEVDHLTYGDTSEAGNLLGGTGDRNACLLVLKDGSCQVIPHDAAHSVWVLGIPVYSRPAGRKIDRALAAFLGVPLVDRGARLSLPSSPSPVSAEWYPDPVCRHEYRYWDGGQWTADVADQGERSLDPLPVGPLT